MKGDRERRKYRWWCLLGVVAGIAWLFYSFSWFTLGLSGDSFADRWGMFWGKMPGNLEGISVVGIGYLVLTGSLHLGMLTAVRNPDSYRTIAILLVTSSGISATVICLMAVPLLLRW